MPVNRDFRDLLASFNDGGVRYLVVGGYALALHGHPRFTKDLDLFVEATPDNARRTHGALSAFGAPLSYLTVEDLEVEGIIFQIGVAPNRIDIVTSIDGVTFAEAWAGRVQSRYGDQEIQLIGRPELIKNKRATGRKQDELDAEILEQDA
jgi:hypothetical protein